MRELTGDGVDVVLDGIGGTVALRSHHCLAPGGRLVLFGHYSTLEHGRRSVRRLVVFYATGGLAAGNLLPGGRRVVTYRSALTRDAHPDWYRNDLGVLYRLHREGPLHPIVAARLPLTEARRAHELLAAGGVHGKLVLFP